MYILHEDHFQSPLEESPSLPPVFFFPLTGQCRRSMGEWLGVSLCIERGSFLFLCFVFHEVEGGWKGRGDVCYTFSTALPKFLPWNRPRRPSMALSIPSLIDSR